MNSSFRKALVGAVVLGATAAGGAFAATALVGSAQSPSAISVDDGSTDTSGTDTATNSVVAVADDTGTGDTSTADDTGTAGDASVDDGHPKGPHEANGITEEVLTGDTAAQATAAAQAAVPDGTVERVETDADGATYEAHMTKADGSRVTVKLNADFTVAGIETDEGGHHGGGRGRHGGGDEQPLAGDALTQATTAAQAAVPGATVERAETDSDGAAYEVHMTKADGSRVTVKLNADFSVAGIEEN